MFPAPATPERNKKGGPPAWNRYAYVLNNPLRSVDPLGFDCVWVNPLDDSVQSITLGDGDCSDTGSLVGYYIEGTIDQSVLITFTDNGDIIATLTDGSRICSGSCDVFDSITATSTPQESYADCVKNDGDYFSLQHGLQYVSGGRLGNSWISEALLGNSISGVIGGVQKIGQGNGAGVDDIGNAAAAEGIGHLEGPAAKVPNFALSYTKATTVTVLTPTSAYTATTARTISAAIPAGTWARVGASLLAVAGTWKDAYDLSVAGFSAVVCGIGR